MCTWSLLLAALPLAAQPPTADQESFAFRAGFSKPELRVVETELGTFSRLWLEGCGVSDGIGSPELPVCRRYVEIPLGSEPQLVVRDAVWVDDMVLDSPVYPRQPPIPKIPGARGSARLVMDPVAWSFDGWTDPEPVRLGEIGTLRGHRFIAVDVRAVGYNPVTGDLRRLDHVDVELSFPGADWEGTLLGQARLAAVGFDTFAARRFLRPEVFLQKPVPPPSLGYVVVVADALAQAVEPLVEYRRSSGFEVTVVKTSEIGLGQDPAPLQAWIQDAYANAEVPPGFVLLVGDTDLIPTFRGSQSRSATDLYYATMDGPDDWLPDLYIGRLSASTAGQVQTIARRTVAYATMDLESGTDWVQRATFMASEDNANITEETHIYVITTWLDPAGYLSNRRFSRRKLATVDQVLDDLNAGLSQLTYSGHGLRYEWSDGPAMSAQDVRSVSGADMPPVVQSYACETGAFDAPECFGETWLRSSNGAVMFIGSSTTSQWDEDDILERGTYDAWFGGDQTLMRAAFNEGLWALHEFYAGRGQTHSYYEQYNVLGDPALDPWTAVPTTPQVAFPPWMPLSGGDFEVTVSDATGQALEGAMVCVYQPEGLHESALTDASGRVLLRLPPVEAEGSAEVNVSGHNLLPVQGDLLLGGDTGSPDSGAPEEKVGSSGGCGCTAGGRRGDLAWLSVGLATLLWWKRRESRVSAD